MVVADASVSCAKLHAAGCAVGNEQAVERVACPF